VPVTVAPLDLSSETALSRSFPFRSAIARIAPLPASIFDVARAIPEAAPVMAITFPLKSVDIFACFGVRSEGGRERYWRKER
jgi:hypothetical protein